MVEVLTYKVDLGNGEWTYPNADMLKHGQHEPKFEGNWGYVEHWLIDSKTAETFRKLHKPKKKK